MFHPALYLWNKIGRITSQEIKAKIRAITYIPIQLSLWIIEPPIPSTAKSIKSPETHTITTAAVLASNTIAAFRNC
jgi:hypothetical protein